MYKVAGKIGHFGCGRTSKVETFQACIESLQPLSTHEVDQLFGQLRCRSQIDAGLTTVLCT